MFCLNAHFSKYHTFKIFLFTEIFGMQMTSFSKNRRFSVTIPVIKCSYCFYCISHIFIACSHFESQYLPLLFFYRNFMLFRLNIKYKKSSKETYCFPNFDHNSLISMINILNNSNGTYYCFYIFVLFALHSQM